MGLRDVLAQEVTPEVWREVVRMAIRYARAGNMDAIKWLGGWAMGTQPAVIEQTVRGTIEHGVSPAQVEDALVYAAGRRRLRVVS